MAEKTLPKVLISRYPTYYNEAADWAKWRLISKGGEEFRDAYLRMFSHRESHEDFLARRSLTPIPAHAKAAVKEIRNSIFQRMGDVTRKDGSPSYQAAIAGLRGGIDNRGSTMNYFLGHKILMELLEMGRVGIYVDMPAFDRNASRAETKDKHPYLYHYGVEDILNYTETFSEHGSEFKALLLRDRAANFDPESGLALSYDERYRQLWIGDDGYVWVQFYDADGQKIDINGQPDGPQRLDITRIPFVMPTIGDSLYRDAGDYQIALLNFVSLDANFEFQSNFAFYTEQRATLTTGEHLKRINSDGTASTGGQGATDEVISVGASHGRYYPKGADRPGFIAPPTDPVMASLKIQEKWEADIRKLVNLAVQTLATRASAESKALDNQGLDSGLSYIGCVLENTERRIADYWSAYEEREPSKRKIAMIKYPDRYQLRSQAECLEEAKALKEVCRVIPSKTAKKEINKRIVTVVLQNQVKPDVLEKMYREIDEAKFATSDPDVIAMASEAGMVSNATGSEALGFEGEQEAERAAQDHADKLARIEASQSGHNKGDGDPGARGVPELSKDPKAGSQEKAESRDTTFSDTNKVPVRGKGK